MKAKEIRLMNAIRRDMQHNGTKPEEYCPRHACMCCGYLSHESTVTTNKPCPLQGLKEKQLKEFYNENTK